MVAAALLATLICPLFSSGCAYTQAPEVTPRAASATLDAAEPIEIVDAAGQQLQFREPPQRWMVTGPGDYMALHLLYMFPGAWDRVVGVQQKRDPGDTFLPLVDAHFESKTVLEGNLGPEQVASVEPDLVIMKGLTEHAVGRSLGEIGIPTLYLGLETPELFLRDVRNLGAALGDPERAQEITAFYQDRLDRLEAATVNLSEADKPRVLLLEYSDRGGNVAVQVPAKSWMQTRQVQTAGGRPVWLESAELTDGWTTVNLEQIALWDPDKVFLVVWNTLDPTAVLASLRADPRWSQLQAVQQDEIYAFPSDLYGWDSPEPRWILGMTWLAKHIHPQPFADIDLIQELYGFFGQMYGMSEVAVQEHILPMVRLDGR
jgi:iron complex transport system substrate-binding protein